VIEGDAEQLLPLVAPVQLVTANIISSVLLILLPAISRTITPGGRAILSGILTSESGEMRRALAEGGWVLHDEDEEDAWWSATIARR
jgi:ribosomal protein L11 methyltransferase